MDACPHINRDDHRCNNRFRLGRLDQAFCVCFGAYRSCLMYHRINRERIADGQSEATRPLVMVTSNGSQVPLRATGT